MVFLAGPGRGAATGLCGAAGAVAAELLAPSGMVLFMLTFLVSILMFKSGTDDAVAGGGACDGVCGA